MLYNRHITVRYACSMDLKQGYTMEIILGADKGREWWKGVGLAQDTCKFLFYFVIRFVIKVMDLLF